MTSQQYLVILHKKVLSACFKGGRFANVSLPDCVSQRALSKISLPSDASVSESYPSKRQTNSINKDGATRVTTQAKDGELPAVEATSNIKWKHLNSSSAAQKYFKKSFFNNYPSKAHGDVTKKDKLDVFGTLSAEGAENKSSYQLDANERLDGMFSEDVDETRDRRLNIPLTREGRIGKKAYYYTRKMSILARQGKIKEAIAIFDHWMMLRDRVMPSKRTFNVLIGILGRVGYTDKAFELYGKMRNLGLDPEDQVYTSLFNACANSPWPTQGLKPAENLLSTLQNNGVQLNLITIKAAVKAMAFCGNFPRAFTIMDEAATSMSLDTECFDHLLMACAADKQAGFGRALQVWQKMQEFKVQPQASSYNLLIRSARDCGIGNSDTFAAAFVTDMSKELLTSGQHKTQDGNGMHLSSLAFEKPNVKDSENNACGEETHSHTVNVSDNNMLLSDSGISNATESLTPMHESHNLFHDIPNFDRDMNEYLMQRDAQREKVNAADMYEWWEEQPSDRQRQHEHQLSLESQVDWSSHQEECLTEGQLNALDLGPAQDANRTVSTASEPFYCTSTENSVQDANFMKALSSVKPTTSQPRKTEVSPLSGYDIRMQLKNIATASERLAVLGGARRLVTHMSESGAAPDVKTFSQLVPCLPNTEDAEDDLLCLMEETGVKPDVDFINDLIMKRNFRHKGHTAKELLPVMSRLGLVPNMRTYAALALTCLKEKDAHNLLQDMKAANLEPSSKVIGHFIYISRTNFNYKLRMLKKMEWMRLAPEPETIKVIEKSIAVTKRNIIAAEEKKDRDSYYLSNEYQESFRRFLHFYKSWLQRTTLHRAPHPWKAFQMTDKNSDETHDKENKTS